jgi:hypothetical protein
VPVVPALVAVHFWRDCGALAAVDWLILWELGMVTVAAWGLSLLAMHDGGRVADAGPGGVARLLARRGCGLLAAGLLLGSLPAAFGLLALASVDTLPPGPAGWLQLAGWWTGQMVVLCLALRGLGLIYRRACRKTAKRKRSLAGA